MHRTKRRGVLAGLAAAVLAALPLAGSPAPASAESVQTGVVTRVVDGDTVLVDLDDDATERTERVRFTGINTTELTTYGTDLALLRGECHGVEATKRLHEMVFGKQVRLVSRYSFSKSKRNRLRRAVYAQLDGEWRDVAQVLLEEGHALWMPSVDEYDRNLDYSTRAGLAARLGKNLWDTDYCGVGPDQDAPLSVIAHWDAPGEDERNLNGEYFELRNAGGTPVALGGWWVRDSQLRRFTFPKDTVLPAGGKLFVHVGKGKARGRHLYWGLRVPAFDNVEGAPYHRGDGAYLFDPEGDLRAWHLYPCRWACPEPTPAV